MARVWLSGASGEGFMPGVEQIEIDADNILRLVRALDRMSPGFAAFIERKVAIAVDGQVVPDWTTTLGQKSEVTLIPRIAGG